MRAWGMRMIASGAGWPAGGPGSGAGTWVGGPGRSADHAGRGDEAVRPVQPTQAPNDRSPKDGSPKDGSPNDRSPNHWGQASADAPGQPGGGRALVPVAPASGRGASGRGASGRAASGWAAPTAADRGPGASGPEGAERARVPVASALRPSVPLAAAGALAVQMAAGMDAWTALGGGSGPDSGGESWPRTAPGTAAAASDSYRRQGGLPPMGFRSGIIFRVSI